MSDVMCNDCLEVQDEDQLNPHDHYGQVCAYCHSDNISFVDPITALAELTTHATLRAKTLGFNSRSMQDRVIALELYIMEYL